MNATFRIDERGSWSGGGAAFLANWRHAAKTHRRLDGDSDAVAVIPRNVPAERRPHRPYVIAPQNAWPWAPVTQGTHERLRHVGLRVAGGVYARLSSAQLRISSTIPAFFPDGRSSPVIHNVLDPGFEAALAESASTLPLPGAQDAFVCLGSATGYRNLALLVAAYADYRRTGGVCGLLVAGPPSNSTVAAEVSRLCADQPGASVQWGRTSRATVLATAAAARGVVLPSLVEASPLSLLEAVAVTPRVVASDIAGHREIVAGHVGDASEGLFDARAPRSLRDHLHRLEDGKGMPQAHRALKLRHVRDGARDDWADAIDGWLGSLEP